MAKCGHCNQIGTKLTEISPTGGTYKMMAICCISCSSILGVTDYFNSGVLLKNAEKERADMKTTLGQILTLAKQMADSLRRR
jgi:hypothetical protein